MTLQKTFRAHFGLQLKYESQAKDMAATNARQIIIFFNPTFIQYPYKVILIAIRSAKQKRLKKYQSKYNLANKDR
ncbi:MAG TPA: hypothetical protein DCP47_07695 [Phycisphaerales bacterium]|nr:hypothetical protein [Phycisphaerales bacterium]